MQTSRNEQTKSVLAFDPGAKRTGVAVGVDQGVSCHSFAPWVACTFLEAQPYESVGTVVVEKWVVYPHAASGNAWRDLLEVRTIGAIERYCQLAGIPVVFQPTSILRPTIAAADRSGYQWRSTNRDEKAAEAHLYYYQQLKGLRTGKEQQK